MSSYPDTPDYEKNDFQNAIKRNLRTWVEWRTMLNDQLVDAVLSGATMSADIEPLDRFLNRSVIDPEHPTTNPKTLLSYSASPSSSTNLRRKCFYKYGLPRVKLDPVNSRSRLEGEGGPRCGSVTSVNSNDLNSHSSQSSLSDEELALDYFYYEGPTSFKRDLAEQRDVIYRPNDSGTVRQTIEGSNRDVETCEKMNSSKQGIFKHKIITVVKNRLGSRSSLECSREKGCEASTLEADKRKKT